MYIEPHVRMTWGGELYGIPDAWENNLRILNPRIKDGELDITEEMIVAVSAPLLAWYVHPLALTHRHLRMTYITYTLIDESGKRRDAWRYNLGKAWAPSWRPMHNPPAQTALAISLHGSGKSRLADKGRVFLPAPNVTLNDSGLINKDHADAIAENFAFLIRLLNHQLNLHWPQAGIGLVSPIRDGAMSFVHRVSCSTTVDTIKARGYRMDNTYTKRHRVEDANRRMVSVFEQPPDISPVFRDIFWEFFNIFTDKDEWTPPTDIPPFE